MENNIITNDYLLDLNKIKETIRENKNKAMVIVNSAMIMKQVLLLMRGKLGVVNTLKNYQMT